MTTKEHIAARDLAGIDIFTELSQQELEPLARACTVREYQPGEHCAVQDEPTDELQVVGLGKVAIDMRIEVAPYSQTLNLASLAEGAVFNWSCLVGWTKHDVSARCIGKTKIICIKAADLLQILSERPFIERIVMKNLARVINQRLKDSRAQLTRLIIEMINQGR
ncbi:Crp/Fnr family transcriptional regulator [Chloroflexota bacterium]